MVGPARSDINVIATGDYLLTANSTAGATRGREIPAAAALDYGNLDTIARITNTTSTSNISGNLLVSADHTATFTHYREGGQRRLHRRERRAPGSPPATRKAARRLRAE